MNAPVLLKVLFESTKPYVMAETFGVSNSDAVIKLTVSATKQINRFIRGSPCSFVNAAVDGRDWRILPLCNDSLKVARASDNEVGCLSMPVNRRQFNYVLMGGLLALPLRGIPLQSALAVNGKRIVDHIL